MKDNFSDKSKDYGKYRPVYPGEVYDFIKTKLNAFETAWDVGTGNGQVAGEIANFFDRVEATDISKNQIKNAVQKENISYSIQSAEKTDFKNEQFDLIISAQAVHWFNFDQFYSEVERCLKPKGLIVIMGYGLFTSNPETNKVIAQFYKDIIGPYWDKERKFLEDHYKTISFPFEEIPSAEFLKYYEWDIKHLLGYLRTWSAVKHYEKENKKDPVSFIESDLLKSFGKKNKIVFPILFKMGKIRKADQ